MSTIKFATSIVFLVIIITGINIVIFFGPGKPKTITAQIAPECPKGLAEAAAQKKYDYDQSQAAFQAMRKGPR